MGDPDSEQINRMYAVMRDRAWVERFVKRAEVSGYTALCLTVDLPVMGVRQRDLINDFKLPSSVSMVNYGKSPVDLAASTAVSIVVIPC
jgi:isopentenyl diphosphate isomerase/L-lactate dehydrogenase-like FMN-dependent dehydrogenase